MVEAVAVAGAGEAFKSTVSHTERELGYLFRFRSSIRELESVVQKLIDMKAHVTRWIGHARRNDEVVREAVNTWLESVDGVLPEATKVCAEAALVNRWFKGWCGTRFKLGRRAAKKIPIVQGLLNDMNAFGGIVSDLRSVQEMGESSLAAQVTSMGGGTEAFGSRVSTLQQVIQALKDDNITMVGVYGMAGVGKTTLASALANYVKMEKIFDEVATAKLAQKPEVTKIQDELANELGLKLEEKDTVLLRSKRLKGRLGQDSKTLIILDNVWERVELAEVGIPDNSKTCKIVFTTRDLDVCNFMETGARIHVTGLKLDESWNLLRQKAGDAVDSPDLQTIAIEIVKICGGLPLALVTVGRALHGKDKITWANALRQLKKSSSKLAGMSAVLSCIKLSYDYLESQEHRLCFLFCSLFPDGYPITMEQLFHYMMGENLLTDVDTLEEARGCLHSIVGRLTSSCLLLETESGCIRMHDVVRETAISIASDTKEGHEFIVKAGIRLGEMEKIELCKCKRLSLSMAIDGHHLKDKYVRWNLSENPTAQDISTLSIHGNGNSFALLPDFFVEMRGLMTLDLSYCGVTELPRSMENLVNLRTLRLDGCDIPSISLSNEWVRLEILSLRYSTIENLFAPGILPNLKLVDISYARCWGGLTLVFLSKCPLLQEISHLKAPATARANRSSSQGGSALIDSATMSEEYPIWGTHLTKFEIVVRRYRKDSPFGIEDVNLWDRSMFLEFDMFLEFESETLGSWVKELVRRTEFLFLKYWESLKHFLPLAPGDRACFHEIKALRLDECDIAVTLLPWHTKENMAEFQEQDAAGAYNFFKSKHFPLFPNLRTLHISNCDKLEYLLPMTIVRDLLQLQELYIRQCHGIKVIFVHENDDDEDHALWDSKILHKLRVLCLGLLPSLTNFVQPDNRVDWSSLEELEVLECPNLKKLTLSPGTVTKLTKLEVDPGLDLE